MGWDFERISMIAEKCRKISDSRKVFSVVTAHQEMESENNSILECLTLRFGSMKLYIPKKGL